MFRLDNYVGLCACRRVLENEHEHIARISKNSLRNCPRNCNKDERANDFIAGRHSFSFRKQVQHPNAQATGNSHNYAKLIQTKPDYKSRFRSVFSERTIDPAGAAL